MEHTTYEPRPWDTTGPNPSQGNTLVIPSNTIPCGHGSTQDLPKFYPGAIIPGEWFWKIEPPEPLFKVKLLNPKAKVPTKAYEGDLGWDLYSVGPYTLEHGHITMIQIGIAIQPRKGWGWIVKDRSSMAKAQVFTHGGVGDNGYRGEVNVGLTCEDPQFYINEGDRVAQIVFVPIAEGGPEVVTELDPSERGARRWGSSGR
jgi:dUTP pyrophosphatase